MRKKQYASYRLTKEKDDHQIPFREITFSSTILDHPMSVSHIIDVVFFADRLLEINHMNLQQLTIKVMSKGHEFELALPYMQCINNK